VGDSNVQQPVKLLRTQVACWQRGFWQQCEQLLIHASLDAVAVADGAPACLDACVHSLGVISLRRAALALALRVWRRMGTMTQH
jgi:hypothetical protein